MITYIKKDQPQYKANLHCHSTVSDGKLTPAELKDAYKNHGYSILCITDHETPCDHTDLTDEDFLMLTGYEAYIRQTEGKHDAYRSEVHINLFAKDPHNVAVVNYNPGYCHYVKDEAAREALVKVGSQEKREYTVEYINNFVKTARENGRKTSKPVLQYTKDGVFVKRFNSGKEAARETGIDHSHILECCAGKRYKSVGGYVWQFEKRSVALSDSQF